MSKAIGQVTLTQSRITKNTVRFDHESEDEFAQPPVRTLYVDKQTFAALGHFPESLTITLTVED